MKKENETIETVIAVMREYSRYLVSVRPQAIGWGTVSGVIDVFADRLERAKLFRDKRETAGWIVLNALVSAGVALVIALAVNAVKE